MGNVLITGITGYIGSRLARELCRTHTVYGLVREPLNTTYLPPKLLDRAALFPYDGTGESIRAALEAVCPEVVYHLAAHYTSGHSFADIRNLISGNLNFGARLLEAMSQTGCRRLVYATTVTTHRTGTEFLPLTLYASIKQAFSDMVEFYAGAGMLRAAAIALADTYGPGDRRPKILNLVRQAILNGTPLDLTSGKQIYDAVYIDDVVRGFISAAKRLDDNLPHQLFQLSSERPRSLRDTVELLVEISGLTLLANWGKKPEPKYRTDQKIELYPAPSGWKQEISLEEGLRRFWSDISADGFS